MTLLKTTERISRVALLGVRFVDNTSGLVVAEGLAVTAWPTLEPSRAVAARRNAANAYYLIDAPGICDLGIGEGDDAYWNGLPRRQQFTIELNDLYGRFLAFRFTAALPVRGLLRLACGSPPTPVPLPVGAESDGVPLFSGPARPTTPGTVVLRAELWDAANHVPAAFAMLKARTPGARLRGEPPMRALADHRGRVALHFSIPDEQDFDGGPFDSPTGGADAPLGARTWVVELVVEYGAIPLDPLTVTRPTPPIPDLCAALAQPPARLWDQLGAGPVALTQVTMRFGQETVVRSSATGSEPPSVLLLTPAQSPP